MRYITLIFIFLFFNTPTLAELIYPNPNIDPKKVISIQLDALMKNDSPFKDAGISQTWEFAHPQNRKFTGPLPKFTKMMKSKSYSIMLNNKKYEIINVSQNDNIANYFVEMTDKIGNKFGFTWTVSKVLQEGNFKNCWMTTSVSQPLPLAKSA